MVARVRPVGAASAPSGLQTASRVVRVPQRAQGSSTAPSVGVLGRDELRDFALDGVLGAAATQAEVFTATTAPLVASLVDGYNGTIMAYGQTGAGKSYTLFGPDDGTSEDAFAERGLCARAISAVFREVSRRGLRGRASMSISALECYNEGLFDMLAAAPTAGGRPRWETTGAQHGGGDPLSRRKGAAAGTGTGTWAEAGGVGDHGGLPGPGSAHGGEALAILEDGEGVASVRGLTVAEAASEDDAAALLFEASTNRTLASHALNSRSSRAHFVFTIHLTVRGGGAAVAGGGGFRDSPSHSGYPGVTPGALEACGDGTTVVSKLHLVDLAGSERGDRTGAVGLVAREASFINKSLSSLEQVVLALTGPPPGAASNTAVATELSAAAAAAATGSHVPYRRSKLTHLLKDSLGGNCRTALVACVWPAAEHLDQTLATLKFAERMRCVVTRPVVNRLRLGAIGPSAAAGGVSYLGDLVEVERLRKQVGVPFGPPLCRAPCRAAN